MPRAFRKATVITYGCQMNAHDSERLKGVLVGQGYVLTDALPDADLVLVNTCSVRDHAEHRVVSLLGRLRGWKASAPSDRPRRIGICGCMAQAWGEALIARHPELDFVLGTSGAPFLRDVLDRLDAGERRVTEVRPPVGPWEETPLRRDRPFQAWITVMEGCDRACAYCVVPRVRGRQRSRPLDRIAAETSLLVQQGIMEITLLGQTVNAWGLDLAPHAGFADLLESLERLPGPPRLRYMSPHPAYMTEEFLRRTSRLSKLCHHFHLPAQSGSDPVLRRMRRGTTRDGFLATVEQIRRYFPGASVTTDLIVGFPGETDAEFAESVSLVRQAGIDAAYTFKYSPRPGTEAFGLPGQVPETVLRQRLAVLQTEVEAQALIRNRALEGRTVEILVEEQLPEVENGTGGATIGDPQGTGGKDHPPRGSVRQQTSSAERGWPVLSGLTGAAKRVTVRGRSELLGRLTDVRICEALPWTLKGELAER